MRYLLILALVSCADTSKLEARVHDLEREVAELRAKQTTRDEASGCAKTTDVAVSDAAVFSNAVPFAISESNLTNGDAIVIREVRGTRPSLEVDGEYVVRGEYTLASADEARVAFTFRATTPEAGCTSGGGSVHVTRGSGTFELKSRAPYVGDASIAFFRLHHRPLTTHDDAIGQVLFGRTSESAHVDSIASKASARAQCKPIDISFPDTTKFPEVVPFEIGRTDLRSGDKITIREVRGTRKDFAVDGIYQVRGDYTLASANEAVIGLNVTGSCTSHTERGHVTVKKGSGQFEVAVKVAYVGQPHVTFYVNGEGSGGVYFGKGDFLAK